MTPLFWPLFWLVPMLAVSLQPRNNWTTARQELKFEAVLIIEAICFCGGLAAAAEMVGVKRRCFYLGAGAALWLGGVLALGFVAGTEIPENVFTMLTSIVYAEHGTSGFGFISLSPVVYLQVLLVSLPFVLLAFCWNELAWKKSPTFALVACLIFLAPVVPGLASWPARAGQPLAVKAMDLLYPLRVAPVRSYVVFAQAHALLKGLFLSPVRGKPSVTLARDAKPLTMVVIVGESTARSHMGLYGYCRNTTPLLSSMADQLFLLRDMISPIPLTIFALSHALRVPVQQGTGTQAQTVLDVFKAAGFQSYWISNQFDYAGDPISSMTAAADHRANAFHAVHGGLGFRNPPDGVLLPLLQQAIAGRPGNKIIFLHAMGTHWTFQDRYPAGFFAAGFPTPPRHRSAEEGAIIDSYDRAVRYSDQVIARVIGAAAKSGGDAAVLYFSDHGEDVYDAIAWHGHRFPEATRAMVEIPALVWLSPGLRAARPGLVQGLRQAEHKRLTLDAVSPLLFDIAGLSLRGFPQSKHPLSPVFAPAPRLVGDVNYEREPDLGMPTTLPPLCDPAPQGYGRSRPTPWQCL